MVTITFPFNVSDCADVAGGSPSNPNAIEVHTRDKEGRNEDADFHLIVICP